MTIEERIKECPFKEEDGCTRYEDVIIECNGACGWVCDGIALEERKKQHYDD